MAFDIVPDFDLFVCRNCHTTVPGSVIRGKNLRFEECPICMYKKIEVIYNDIAYIIMNEHTQFVSKSNEMTNLLCNAMLFQTEKLAREYIGQSKTLQINKVVLEKK